MNSFTQKKTDSAEIIRKTLALAENWQNRANTLLTKNEKKRQQMMSRLLNHPSDKTVVMHLIDQSFRSRNPHRVVDQLKTELASAVARQLPTVIEVKQQDFITS